MRKSEKPGVEKKASVSKGHRWNFIALFFPKANKGNEEVFYVCRDVTEPMPDLTQQMIKIEFERDVGSYRIASDSLTEEFPLRHATIREQAEYIKILRELKFYDEEYQNHTNKREFVRGRYNGPKI